MTLTAPARHSRSRRTWHVVRHYLEMVVAMLVGMVVLAPVWRLVWPGLSDTVAADVPVMATDMALGMAAWMRVRRHSWSAIGVMSAAMYLPFVVLLVPFAAGAVTGDTVMMAGHVLMFPAMALAMLWHRDEYLH
jgi:hypothetical protein